MSGFSPVGEEPLFTTPRLKLVRGRFSAPDGSIFERDIVRNQEVVAMVPLHPDGSVTLVSQYRGAVDAELLEIPAGLCDIDGEPYENAARRELIEEVGLDPQNLELIASYFPSAGFSDQFVRLYLATGLREVADSRQGPEEEAMTVERINISDVPGLIASSRLTDAKTVIGLLLALRWWESQG